MKTELTTKYVSADDVLMYIHSKNLKWIQNFLAQYQHTGIFAYQISQL